MAEKGKKSGPGSFQTIPCQIRDKKGLQMFDFSHNITKRKKCRSFSKYSDQGCWAMFLVSSESCPNGDRAHHTWTKVTEQGG